MAKGAGRKVYRNVAHAKKMRVKKFFSVLLALFLLAILVFLGYSVAKPIFNYFNSEENFSEDSLPWTPPVSEEGHVETEYTESDDSSQTEVTVVTEAIIELSDEFTAYMLPKDALESPAKLAGYINQAKSNGYNAVTVTLKAEGGKIHYATASEFAKSDENTVVGTMSAEQICKIIKDNGLKAFALINLLEDNSRYGENRDGSYHSIDGSTWLDNSVSNGGKPWLSPFENATIIYVAYITNEIVSSGFDAIITDGICFPDFRNSDLNLIGNSVKSQDRYTSLISLITMVSNVTGSRNIMSLHTFDADDIIDNTEEEFKPEHLTEKKLLIEYSSAKIGNTVVYNNSEIILSDLSEYEKFKTIWTIIKEKAGTEIELIPLIVRSEYNPADYDAIITELISQGHKSYIVR